MKKIITALVCFMFGVAVHAQIGYQVTLLNTATGEPRTNETVNVRVTITDFAGGIVCSETKSATTNDFGILSLAVDSQDTFAGADWSKLPFFIEAAVDGVMIGRSQLLTVPVAEHANHTGVLTKEKLKSKKWTYTWASGGSTVITFEDNTCRIVSQSGSNPASTVNGRYAVWGNMVVLPSVGMVLYDPTTDELIHDSAIYK